MLPFLKYEGIQCLDGIFVSHPDTDHISGILELLEDEESQLKVRNLVLAAIAPKRRQEEFSELLLRAEEAEKLTVSYMGAGTEWMSGSVRFCCLHPQEGTESNSSNAYSQCFLVSCGAFSMLLTGDVEGEGEQQLQQVIIREGISDLSVLKVAHHGSANSSPGELLERLRPLVAVISCGVENPYGHPHEALLERLKFLGSRIMSTAEYGAVTVEIYDDKMKATGYLQ